MFESTLYSQSKETIQTKKILYLSSYDINFTWTRTVTEGLFNFFYEKKNIAIYSEFMDANRFQADSLSSNFLMYLKNKYQSDKVDIIICADNAALNLVLANPNFPLFKNIQITFCGITNPMNYPLEKLNLYGVEETDMFKLSFPIIKKIDPNFRHIYAFLESSETGRVYKKLSSEIISNNPGYKITYIDTIDLATIKSVIEAIPEGCLIYYFGINVDKYGNAIDNFRIAQEIVNYAKAPAFSSYTVDVVGFTGGVFNPGQEHGRIIGELAYSLLNGQKISPRVIVPEAILTIDYQLIKKYNLDVKNIPANAIINNKPESLVEKYKTYILTYSAFVIILLLVIGLLYRYNIIYKHSKNSMKQARDKALEADRVKGAFLANVSHELRTPLNAISGFSELALAETEPEEIKKFVRIIFDNSETLSQQVNDLLDVSMLDAHQIKIVPKKINIEKLYRNLYEQTRSLLLFRNKTIIKIKLVLSKEYITFFTDELRLKQIMLNFINNSVKFTDKGSITLGLCHIAEMPMLLNDFPEFESALVFYVSDTGLGIGKDKLHLVFDRFRRVETKYMNQHGGVGLGLNIAQTLAEMMGGKTFVTSEPKRGSTFGVILPLIYTALND